MSDVVLAVVAYTSNGQKGILRRIFFGLETKFWPENLSSKMRPKHFSSFFLRTNFEDRFFEDIFFEDRFFEDEKLRTKCFEDKLLLRTKWLEDEIIRMK